MTVRRAPRGTISRERIVDTAVIAARRDGLDTLSLRALAATLEVSPMALYRHVDDKDDLLAEVVDRLLADRWAPDVDRADWRAWLVSAAELFRAFLVSEPAARQIYLSRPVSAPTAMARMDAAIEVLTAGLGDAARAHRAYAAVQTYTLGFAALEAGRQAAAQDVEDADAGAAEDPATDGATAERLREIAAFSSPAQFRIGLGYLLDGIAGEAREAGEAGEG